MNKGLILLLLFAALLSALIFSAQGDKPVTTPSTPDKPKSDRSAPAQRIVLGGGCFWCIEAVFQRLPGVNKVTSGYAGGQVENPTYEQVCGYKTGHAEVVEVEFDPTVAPLDRVLEVFFAAHDPTTPNRQGNDVGPQYRSAIFYADEPQKQAAEAAVQRAREEWKHPIVTEIAALKKFYPAEAYHQNYYNQNANKNPYCSIVIAPKLKKLVQKGVIRE